MYSFILYFVNRASRYDSCKQPTWRTSFNVFIYFTSLHVSNSTVFIIRRSIY